MKLLKSLVLFVFSYSAAQNVALRSYAFDMAFGITNGPSGQAKFTVGEVFSGLARGTNFAVGSGFIADTVVQNPLTAVENDDVSLPVSFALKQNFPNPFNPSTTIAYDLPRRSSVRIAVFNILGQLVTTLVQEEKAAGRYSVVWRGRTDHGVHASSGVYFYRIQATRVDDGHNFVDTKKLLLLK
ncbi:MAG: T9SS type A sorting domain-containing protein [Ignavibacteriales bacterium]|nr:T9SS type A sorting domain-containing protein [Ignavibacteriales bacterium]